MRPCSNGSASRLRSNLRQQQWTCSQQWICQPCLQKRSIATKLSSRAKQRKLTRQDFEWKQGAKMALADAEWAKQAARIRAGEQTGLWQTLKERGYIHQVAGDEKELERIMIDKRVGVYAGIDPTAASMHVGHLLPFMVLLWFYVHGYRAVSLLGGATSRIGDPSGRLTTRDRQESSLRKANMASMHLQIVKIWDNMERYAEKQYGYQRRSEWKRGLVNNNKWWNKLPVMDFMHYAGQLVRVGQLLSRDTLDSKTGMSFAELSYPIMQGWDWWELYKQQDVQIQIGGADQFGNIIAGMDVVNKIVPRVIDPKQEIEKFDENATRFGFTVPLLTTSSGEKIGKSEGNAIWLDHTMTAPFDLYAYFLTLSDADAIRFLKLFTLMPLSDISNLESEHMQAPQKRLAHHRLAFDVLALVHGLPCATSTASQHAALFGGRKILGPQTPKTPLNTQHPSDLNVSTNPNALPINSESMWTHNAFLPRSLVENQPAARILFHAGLVATRSEGQRLINARGAYYGGETGMEKMAAGPNTEMPDELKFARIADPSPQAVKKMLIGGDTLILRTGKTKIRIIRVLDDDEFDSRGLSAPGWEEWKRGVAVESAGLTV